MTRYLSILYRTMLCMFAYNVRVIVRILYRLHDVYTPAVELHADLDKPSKNK